MWTSLRTWKKAVQIIVNAKTSRPSVCNAEEVCLVHRAVARQFLPMLRKALVEDRAVHGLVPVELRLDPAAAPSSPALRRVPRTLIRNFWITFLPLVRGFPTPPLRTLPPTPPVTARPSSPSVQTRPLRPVRQRRRLCERLHSLYRRRRIRPGLRNGHFHPEAPRPKFMGLDELSTYKYIITGNGQIR